MGIRFNCPNGHRLNVKTFLAGKRGYCPHCGVKLQIPQQSQLDPQSKAKGKPTAVAETAAFRTSAQSKQPQATGSNGATSRTLQPALTESVWYIRPPSGGQFGPATSDVLNQWVAEGRVPPNSLLWREGWSDWKPATDILTENGGLPSEAGDAFDDVSHLGLENAASNSESETVAPQVAIAAERSVGSTFEKLRKRKKTGTKAAVFLCIAAILLFVALMVIIY